MKRSIRTLKDNQNGAVIVLVAILTVLFLGIAALAIDVYHVYVVRNELQNAADAGALYGARVLYLDDGESVNPGANDEAYNTAVANLSEKVPVELIYNAAGNSGDVQRGHWSLPPGSSHRTVPWRPSISEATRRRNWMIPTPISMAVSSTR